MNTRSKKTDGPKVLREMFEECEAGRWEAAAITRAKTVEEVIVGASGNKFDLLSSNVN